ncbi:MAG TPA: hypothetical protein VGP82_11435 [Ktedonobacterales bacterium]|jgi:hypothetical protein|nr:hypothetical protein [Ktedonobacterales bacterium]
MPKHLPARPPLDAREERQLPYVRLPGDEFGRYIAEHSDELQRGCPRINYLLWSDILLDFQDGRPAFGRRVRAGATLRGRL